MALSTSKFSALANEIMKIGPQVLAGQFYDFFGLWREMLFATQSRDVETFDIVQLLRRKLRFIISLCKYLQAIINQKPRR